MAVSAVKFAEQYSRIQQQFKEWTQFEQLYAIVELTRTFQLSYHHFLIQLFQANIQLENNDMFNHTLDDANAPDIVSCLLSCSLDKILFTIQLYLPLISAKTLNEKLYDAYRDILIYLDSNILNSTKFTYNEPQIINFSQQILFFIHKNPYLTKLSLHVPQLIKLVQTGKFQSNDQQSYHQQLLSYPSIRASSSPLMNYPSECLPHNTTLCMQQQLTRHETDDSGVDVNENSMTNSLQNIFSLQNSFIDRSYKNNLSSSPANKHSFVAKTASSPIPEYVTLNPLQRTPLQSALSAPPSTVHSDYRNGNGNYSQKHIPVLTKSDEEEPESHKFNDDYISDTSNLADNSKILTQFRSLRYPNTRNNRNKDNVSQYLAIDTNSSSLRNTFTQPNTGMRDVPKWLRHLRLHKYDVFFSQMTYDQMMNLTIEDLKELHIVDGACTKIILNIKKLKERSALLKQWLLDMDDGQFDLQNVVEKLNELMITPIRSKQLELENKIDEDLPALVMQILEKIYKQLTPNTLPDTSNSVLGLFDRCYKHEAFTDDQRNILLHWRGHLSHMLQSLGKIEYKTIQSAFSHPSQQRRTGKTLRHFRSTVSPPFYSNHSTNSVGLGKFKSEPQNNYNEANIIRRPNKSPTQIHTKNEESNENYLQTSFSCSASTPPITNDSYSMNIQRQALTRKPSINPSDETNANTRTKLCKTFSDPSKIRFYNPTQINQMQLSSCRNVQEQNLFRMISTPYSQQHRNFISRSPQTTTTIELPSSPIKKCFSDHERPDYYGNQNNSTPLSSISNTTDIENNNHDQRHHNTEIESLCRQITESAMGDDVNDLSLNPQEKTSDISNVQQSSNSSTDTEQ